MTKRKSEPTAHTAVTPREARAWLANEANELPDGVRRPGLTRGRLSFAAREAYETLTGNVIVSADSVKDAQSAE